jgi:hypothetical protein
MALQLSILATLPLSLQGPEQPMWVFLLCKQRPIAILSLYAPGLAQSQGRETFSFSFKKETQGEGPFLFLVLLHPLGILVSQIGFKLKKECPGSFN